MRIKYDDDVSMPIRHPMRFAIMNSDFYKKLNTVCDGSHKHACCVGNNTRYAYGYTDEVVKIMSGMARQKEKDDHHSY